MKTVTCPSCGLGFETAATTNTRCRRCRKVVRVGTGPGRRTASLAEGTELDNGYYSETDYSDEEEGPPASGWALAALTVGAVLVTWLASRGGKEGPSLDGDGPQA